MKKLVISALFVMQVFFVFAQNVSGISGKVVDSKTQKPLQNAIASIQNSNLTQLTNAEGVFIFENVIVGSQLVQIKSSGYNCIWEELRFRNNYFRIGHYSRKTIKLNNYYRFRFRR
jgi:hypothetical protein